MRWVSTRILKTVPTIFSKVRVHQMTRSLSMRGLFQETPVTIPAVLEVKLTPEEDRLCTLLDECKRDLDVKGTSVECRIAGGWVRDKLLGSQSDDIDIALANMMGVAFAENLVSYLKSKDIPVRSIHKIERNPEQSKHLETAHTKVLGFEVDFVNLRSEEYTEDSRIPTEVRLGTPLEDALRRDITFNAMFYNVHTRSVEDFTEKGLDDLRSGILRTPLPPRETFMDDPLRVLRCIRFASRYGFKLSTDIEEASREPNIQAAIISKISKERVGTEFEKMMGGRDPVQSMHLITSLGLQSAVFALPSSISSTLSSDVPSEPLGLVACAILRSLLSSPSTLELPSLHPLLLSQLSVDAGLRQRLFFAASLSSFRGITFKTPKGETKAAVEAVIREALKRGQQNHFSDGIPSFFAAADVLRNPSVEHLPGESNRSKIGLLLRTKCVHNKHTGSHWSSSLLFSLIQELVASWSSENDNFDVEAGTKVVEIYNSFTKVMEELGLPESIDEKPLLNGKEIISVLDAPKSGPWLGGVMTSMETWQLDHPSASREECEAWLISEKDAGRINITSQSTKPKKKDQDTAESPSKKAKIL